MAGAGAGTENGFHAAENAMTWQLLFRSSGTKYSHARRFGRQVQVRSTVMPVWKDADEVEVIGPRSTKLHIKFCTATRGFRSQHSGSIQ